MNYPTNTDDVIDSRDVIEALVDLAKLHQAGPVELDGEFDGKDANEIDQDSLFYLESTLVELAKQGEDYAADWEYGETLVRDSYFQEYAQELCDASGEILKDFPYYIVIDWEATARNIQQDYTSIDFDGVTYWVR